MALRRRTSRACGAAPRSDPAVRALYFPRYGARRPGVFPGYLPASGVPDPFDQDGYLKTGDILQIAGDELEYLRDELRT